MWITRGLNSVFNYRISLTNRSMRGLQILPLCPRGDLNPFADITRKLVLIPVSSYC